MTFAKGGAPIRRRLSLADLVRDSLAFVLSGSRGTSRVELPDDLWAVDADEGQFVQVFNNLFLNAVQAMPGGGRITVTGENVVADGAEPALLPAGRYVRVRVRDEGPGIPAANLRRIFDPFFTTKPGGTGLGLSTVYSILRRHGGHIEVESAEGRGTTFAVWVPASPEPAAPSTRTRAAAACAGSGRVIVMDDEPQVREIVGRFLRQAGYEVDLAAHGGEVIELFRTALARGTPVDAVILDLTVPDGLGGRETLEQLRALDPQVRAIVSSGYSEDPVIADHRAYGFRGALTKPYDLNELAELLRSLVND